MKDLLGDVTHVLDICTDLQLAYKMYALSRVDFGRDDYNICFVWICLATFGPYLVQFSSHMSLLYNKGVYQDKNLKGFGCCKKLSLLIQLSAFGFIQILLIDLVLKIETVINALLIPFTCGKKGMKPLRQRVQERLRSSIGEALEMTDFEIMNFKQQSKYIQFVFEDFPMLVLDFFIVTGVLTVPKIFNAAFTNSGFAQQLVLTSYSTYTALSELFFQSDALGESRLEYLLTCLKARQNWIPFGTQLE